MPLNPTVEGPLGSTDITRWRLDSTDHGRHVWSYQPKEGENSNLYARYARIFISVIVGLLTDSATSCYLAYRGKANPLTLAQKSRDYQTNEEKYWLGLPTVSSSHCSYDGLSLADAIIP